MLLRITYALTVFLLFKTVLSQFTRNSSCYSQDCSVICGSNPYDLTDISVYLPSYTQIQYTSYYSTFTVAFVIPVCGSEPASTYDWSEGDIWQYDNGGTYYLGLYNDEWTYGTYNGEPALNVLYSNGEYCTVTGQSRFTNLYLVCNEYYTATSPLITVTEPSVCQYSIVVQYEDICFVVPSSSPSPSASPVFSSSSSSGGSSSGLSLQTKVLIPFVLVIFLLIVGIVVYYFYYKSHYRGMYSPHVQMVETYTANNDNSIVNIHAVYAAQHEQT